MPQIDLKPLPPAEAVSFFRSKGFAASIKQHALLAPPGTCGLVASILAVVVVEREVGWAINPGQPGLHHDGVALLWTELS